MLAVVVGNKIKIIYYLFIFSLVLFWISIAFTRTSLYNHHIHGFIVHSQSMEPILTPGSLVIVIPQPSYSSGDVVTYTLKDNPDKNPITHRIFKVITWDGQQMFVTKGDANTIVDNQIISQDEIIGQVIYQIPYIGMFIYTAQTPVGSFFYVILPVTIIFFIEIENIIKTLKQNKK